MGNLRKRISAQEKSDKNKKKNREKRATQKKHGTNQKKKILARLEAEKESCSETLPNPLLPALKNIMVNR